MMYAIANIGELNTPTMVLPDKTNNITFALRKLE